VTHTEKKKVIEKLLNVPDKQKRLFWGREIKTLNILIEVYPESKFWKGLTFPQKLDSMILFRSGYYQQELKRRYNLYKYNIPPKKEITLGDKTGKDYTSKKKVKTIKDFLS
jgi:hypothetical protein